MRGFRKTSYLHTKPSFLSARSRFGRGSPEFFFITFLAMKKNIRNIKDIVVEMPDKIDLD